MAIVAPFLASLETYTSMGIIVLSIGMNAHRKVDQVYILLTFLGIIKSA